MEKEGYLFLISKDNNFTSEALLIYNTFPPLLIACIQATLIRKLMEVCSNLVFICLIRSIGSYISSSQFHDHHSIPN
jgi:hypothetical protein